MPEVARGDQSKFLADKDYPSRSRSHHADTTLARGLVMVGPVGSPRFDPADWEGYALSRLRDLVLLPSDWDGEGSQMIGALAVERSLHLIRVLVDSAAPLPSLAPTQEGGVSFEWSVPSLTLEIEALPTPNPGYTLFFRRTTGESWEGPLGEEPDDLSKLLWQVSLG
jgi:hypothetical protein